MVSAVLAELLAGRRSVLNQAVADAQSRLQARVMELDIEIHEEEFQYWTQRKRK